MFVSFNRKTSAYLTAVILVTIALITIARPSVAAVYYVSNSQGSDSNNGLSQSSPWKSIAKVNTVNFQPGDTIKFKSSDVWREQLTIPSSGANGNPITFTSYGTGDKPLILGSVEKNSTGDWNNSGADQWATVNGSFPENVGNMIFDNEASVGIMVWDRTDLDSQGEFWHDSVNKRVILYSMQNPALAYSDIEIPKRYYGIDLGTHSYITISNLAIKYINVHAIRGGSGSGNLSNITIRYVDISYAGGKVQFPAERIRYGNGIEFWQNASDILVEYCNISQIFDAALTNQSDIDAAYTQENITYRYNTVTLSNIAFAFFTRNPGTVANNIYVENNNFSTEPGWSGGILNTKNRNLFLNREGTVTNFYIRDNIFEGSKYMEVIRLVGGGFTFERNIIRNGQKYGILISIHPLSTVKLNHKNILRYNQIYGHAREGIYFLDDIDPLEVYNNVIANNNILGGYPNVYISATTTYSTWKNNILVGNMKMDTSSVILDNNCYYRESGPMITYLGVDYTLSEFAAYQAASGRDANSIASDPLFVDGINNDFHLSAGSPCIDAGVDVGLSEDFDKNPVIPPPDIGAFEALPDITANPASRDFGTVAVGYASQGRIFTISNNGTTDLVIGGVYLTGTNPYQFSILNDTCANTTIAPSGTCTIEARYEPTKTGTMYAKIGIDSNDPDTPKLYIDLTGTGVNTTPPVADPGGPYTGIEGQAITLDGSGSTDSDGTITLYEWDIDNDGTFDYSSTLPTWNHIYAQQGAYTINLRVTDDLGATDEATTTATVSDTSPTADFTGSPISGIAPLTVNFADNSTGYDQPLSHEWDFDNNGLIDSTVQNPSYIYNTAGTYTVSLTVRDADGSANSLTRTNYITVCLSPVRIEGATPVYYSTLQAAYDAAADGDVIRSRAVVFIENLNINRNISVTLEGGYDCDYATVTGVTTINGTMTVSDGTVSVENVVVE